jgi:hypothetical protein
MRPASWFRIGLTALLVLTFEAAGRAQPAPAPAPGSPEATLARAMDEMSHDRIEKYTEEMHPDALTRFRTTMTAIIDAADKEGKSGQIVPLFGVKSVADLKVLDDRQFFVKYLRGVMGLQPELKKAMAGAKVDMLGRVDEGTEKTHIIYKLNLTFDGTPIESITVNSLQKQGPKWALLLSGDTEGMVAMMKQQLAGKRVVPDRKASRVEPVGRFVKDKATGPAYVVYRMITPVGDSQVSAIAVLTVEKSDASWAVAERGKPEELTGLIREKLALEPAAAQKP